MRLGACRVWRAIRSAIHPARLAVGFGENPPAQQREEHRGADGIDLQQSWPGTAPLIHIGGLAVMGRAAAVGFRQQLVVQPAKSGDQQHRHDDGEHTPEIHTMRVLPGIG